MATKTKTAPKTRTRVLSSVGPLRGSAAAAADAFRRDGPGYENVLGNVGAEREVTAHERAKLVRLSRLNYKRSGVYGQVLDTLVNFAIGDGATINAKDQKLQAELKRELENPDNAWDRTLRQKVTTLLVDGEVPLTLIVQARGKSDAGKTVLSGNVTIGRLEPETIEGVLVSPLNVDNVRAIRFRDPEKKESFELPIARPGVELKEMPGGDRAACLLWRVNTLGRRGLPYLSRSLDKASMLDSVVDELARKAEYTNRFWLHATYEPTGDARENKKVEKELLAWLRSWTPGEAAVTTGNVKVSVISPSLAMPDVRAFVEMLLEYILGSHGIPRMWYASGGDTNRATAVEQGTPIHRAIDALQAEIRAAIEDVVRFVVWVLQEAGRAPKTEKPKDGAPTEDPFTVTMADVATRDSIRDVNELQSLTTALDGMVESGIISWEERQAIGRRALQGKSFGDLIRDENAPKKPAEGLDRPPPGALPGHDDPNDPADPEDDGMGAAPEAGKGGAGNLPKGA